ncbi:MAG: tRNA 4-thiouridine(8) synthase ThiI [Candidatus Micrarchaeota archaeon]|nr:tRNA 4-thiouridine(8) synthase ThiI [Candidatus Micrarchaeota archaeon]
MNEYEGILIHFGEIWLKGRNRSSFVNSLYDNVRLALSGESYSELRHMRDRFFLVFDSSSDRKSIEGKLSMVFGISRFSPVITCGNDLDSMVDAANRMLKRADKVRIVPHRSVKSLSFDSSDVVSHFIKNTKRLKFKIDKDARKDLYINATKNVAFLYTERIGGANGLPVGSSGSAVVLFSGGIDSPVASFYAMKRGLRPIYMHVHAFPDNGDERLSKIKSLGRILSSYSNDYKLCLMPGHVFQSAALKTPRKYELVLFKLFLYRIAEEIAKKEGAGCIVSGESLGQVASQTVGNLTSSQYGIKRLIIRPLIGFDKQEIINVAKRIGTYEESIKKYKDVCSIAARSPATSSEYLKIRELWKKASMDSAVRMTLRKMSVSG